MKTMGKPSTAMKKTSKTPEKTIKNH